MTLDHYPATRAVLDALHAAAARDARRWRDRTGTTDATVNAGGGGALVRLGEFYLAVSPDEGRLLYILARAIKAGRIVEFGASYGISSLYLAAAARDNAGTLITTEVHPDKCAALRATFAATELADAITLLEGDARETLRPVSGPIDMLFLDGWKSAYLPIFELLRPSLRAGALIVADNCTHAAAADYLAVVQSPASGCITSVRDSIAISCVLP
ncbi:O-methyltransferase [Marinovum sp.]|uniref:O-methyltransferase n=1 Tax=Marinovum sp. TaxID=2024839 RepID=UPI002B26EB7C|nr:class I SAM-dependent methyltransferase [Marinovum sp.]